MIFVAKVSNGSLAARRTSVCAGHVKHHFRIAFPQGFRGRMAIPEIDDLGIGVARDAGKLEQGRICIGREPKTRDLGAHAMEPQASQPPLIRCIPSTGRGVHARNPRPPFNLVASSHTSKDDPATLFEPYGRRFAKWGSHRSKKRKSPAFSLQLRS